MEKSYEACYPISFRGDDSDDDDGNILYCTVLCCTQNSGYFRIEKNRFLAEERDCVNQMLHDSYSRLAQDRTGKLEDGEDFNVS